MQTTVCHDVQLIYDPVSHIDTRANGVIRVGVWRDYDTKKMITRAAALSKFSTIEFGAPAYIALQFHAWRHESMQQGLPPIPCRVTSGFDKVGELRRQQYMELYVSIYCRMSAFSEYGAIYG